MSPVLLRRLAEQDDKAVLGCALLALLLRLPRVPARWDEVALAYAAYPEPTLAALERGDLLGALSRWMGLHPPLWPLLHALSEALLPVPALWLLGSVLASTAAVLLVGRAGGWLAALVLATAPLQVAYAAEVNNYPLAVLMVALVLACGQGRWGWLALAVILAGWTHVLAGVAGVGVVLWRAFVEKEQRWRLLGAVGLGLFPVGVGALRRMGEGSTFGQPEVEIGEWVRLVGESVGIEGILLVVIAMIASAKALTPPFRPPSPASGRGFFLKILAALLAMALVLAATLLAGAAAPHQRPYFLLFGPPFALLIGRAGRGRLFATLVVILCLLRAGRTTLEEIDRLQQIQEDPERAIDVALEASKEGDLLWLVAPALQADDDKTAISPVLSRISPLSWMPMARELGFEYRDWRYGQPRHWRGRTLHTSTELYEGPFDHAARATLERGGRVWVVLYEHGPASGLHERVLRVLRPYRAEERRFSREDGLGDDHLWRIEGLR